MADNLETTHFDNAIRQLSDRLSKLEKHIEEMGRTSLNKEIFESSMKKILHQELVDHYKGPTGGWHL